MPIYIGNPWLNHVIYRVVTPKVPDLLIAAAAEAANLTIIHYDADFDLIASVTGQTCQWIVPKGSID